MGKRAFLSAPCGHWTWLFTASFFMPFVCADVEFKTIQKDPHPRNLEQGSIVILLEYLFLSDLG